MEKSLSSIAGDSTAIGFVRDRAKTAGISDSSSWKRSELFVVAHPRLYKNIRHKVRDYSTMVDIDILTILEELRIFYHAVSLL